MTATQEVQLSEVLVSEVSEGTAPPVCLCPWDENPYRLVSLLDMLRFYAEDFCHATALIGQIYMDLQSKVPQDISWAAASSATKTLERHCKNIDLPVTLRQIERVHGLIESGVFSTNPQGFARIGREIADISVRLIDELKSRQIFLMQGAHVSYYEQTEPLFGLEVRNNFPSAAYDITEAGKCYSLNRWTACVFHLMRVLERGLSVFADRFGIPSDHTNWHNIIEGIEKAVRNMANDPVRPADWKDQQEFFSQAASHFMVLKDAWRNYTAHARGKYTDEEAEMLIMNVRGFMQKLATRLHE
jgi:hypothetical protein